MAEKTEADKKTAKAATDAADKAAADAAAKMDAEKAAAGTGGKKRGKPRVVVVNRGQDGYRRGGHAHPKGEADYDAGHFDAKALAAIKADPDLEVREEAAPD